MSATTVVARTPDWLLAHVWRDLLVSAGIPADVLGESMSTVYPGLAPLASLTVLVRAEDADRARELLAEASRQADRSARDADGDA